MLPTAPAASPYETNLDKTTANYAQLTPIGFLGWAAGSCPQRTAVIHGERRFTWAETFARCRRLASALAAHGVGRGDTVAVMLLNTPEMYECHFGVPMTGAVLNTLNVRLDAPTLAFMLDHGEARVLITDREFSDVIAAALARCAVRPLVIDVDDPVYGGPGARLGELEYEALLAAGDPDYRWTAPADEWDAISLNYTSGTTGNPKGVVFHHRGAYLNGLGEILAWCMPRFPVFLWTVPMFHCNGWCFPWTIAALAGTNICLRRVETETIFRLIREHRVTHYGGAPIVHNTLLNAPAELWAGIEPGLKGFIAGAAPPAATLEAMERRGVELTHVYGLTEVYGPATLCVKQEEWLDLDARERAVCNGRQGMRFIVEEEVAVLDPGTMAPVPWDGQTIGEIMFRGNITMKGYLKNPEATEAAFAGGWFHSGDLAVMHPDGYFKVKDRGKDIIISGGENISSLEVEDVLHRHPAVFAAAVVAQPDRKWGETPCAFVELKPGTSATEADLIEHCRTSLAHYKAPKAVVFGTLPKTATGKIQKYVLRERARSTAAIE
ncbi:MAG TPA: acyl-CoA synthetase [Gemmatimonadales bacterium]|nr:acyl-CoA synthetase [Gemmatimonadales bacterium]